MRVVDGDALTKGLRGFVFFYAPLSLMRLKVSVHIHVKNCATMDFNVNLFYCEKSLIRSNKIIFLGRI